MARFAGSDEFFLNQHLNISWNGRFLEKMKTSIFPRWGTLAATAMLMVSATSCMTTYDANGNPVQSVDPGAAAAGAVAAGVLGYAIANNHNHHDHYYYGGGGYYGRGYYQGGRRYGRSYNSYNRGGRYR